MAAANPSSGAASAVRSGGGARQKLKQAAGGEAGPRAQGERWLRRWRCGREARKGRGERQATGAGTAAQGGAGGTTPRRGTRAHGELRGRVPRQAAVVRARGVDTVARRGVQERAQGGMATEAGAASCACAHNAVSSSSGAEPARRAVASASEVGNSEGKQAVAATGDDGRRGRASARGRCSSS
nr:glycine-rich protein 1-like [Aegilops tauschii subsp. strangulata]